jgi:hypothetical protein
MLCGAYLQVLGDIFMRNLVCMRHKSGASFNSPPGSLRGRPFVKEQCWKTLIFSDYEQFEEEFLEKYK